MIWTGAPGGAPTLAERTVTNMFRGIAEFRAAVNIVGSRLSSATDASIAAPSTPMVVLSVIQSTADADGDSSESTQLLARLNEFAALMSRLPDSTVQAMVNDLHRVATTMDATRSLLPAPSSATVGSSSNLSTAASSSSSSSSSSSAAAAAAAAATVAAAAVATASVSSAATPIPEILQCVGSLKISRVNMVHLIVEAVNQDPTARASPIVLPPHFIPRATSALIDEFRGLQRRFAQTQSVVDEAVRAEAVSEMIAQALGTSITVLGYRLDQVRHVVAPSTTTSLVPTSSPANTSVQLEFKHLNLKSLKRVCEPT